MFTGIIQAVGKIAAIEQKGGDARLRVDTGRLDMSNVNTGDSIAVSGVCLTAVEHSASGFADDVSGETRSGTTLGGLLVGGHWDGVGSVVSREEEGRAVRFRFQAPDTLARYIAEKGSICVDGVSLTVNAVNGAKFDVNIVPHTLAQTTLDSFQPGSKVNLEVDLLARYLERLVLGEGAAQSNSSITREFLAQHGFIK